MLCQQLLCICGSSYDLLNQFFFIDGRIDSIPSVFICCIIIQRLLQGSNNTYIIDDETVALAGSNTVCPGDCLHQRMRLQRLIQIQTRQRLNIETGQPHRTNENNTEIAVGILEFLIKFPLLHFCPMRQNIQIPLLKGLDLILLLTYDHTHFGVFHPFQLPGQFHLLLIRNGTCNLLFKCFDFLLPVFLYEVVHTDTRDLIQADEHSLSCSPQITVMPDKILCDCPQTWLCCQKMYFLLKFVHYLFSLIRIQIGFFNGIQNLIRDVRILDLLYLIATVFVIKRNRSLIFYSALKVVYGNIATECPGRNLIGG